MKFPKTRTRSLRFMNQFGAVELHACVEYELGGKKLIDQEDEEQEPTMFSVYGRRKDGCEVRCLEDFKTHAEALAWMKAEAARCKFEFGYADYWEHGRKEEKPTREEVARRCRARLLNDGAPL